MVWQNCEWLEGKEIWQEDFEDLNVVQIEDFSRNMVEIRTNLHERINEVLY